MTIPYKYHKLLREPKIQPLVCYSYVKPGELHANVLCGASFWSVPDHTNNVSAVTCESCLNHPYLCVLILKETEL